VGLAHDAAPEIGESDADADADADGDVSAGAASVACLGSRLEDEADAAMRFRQLLSSLKGLGSDCHQAFVMHKIKELSYAEVACHMGITVSMVEKHLSKALHYLGIGRQSLAERRSQR
jgi:RNA polymerase sigma factor (sigma-70 family)